VTQHQILHAALLRHGCKPVKAHGRNWMAWSTGDLAPATSKDGTPWFFFFGLTGFRYGSKRATSHDWPKMKARLLAEAEEIRL
jgi:hypothetical protein